MTYLSHSWTPGCSWRRWPETNGYLDVSSSNGPESSPAGELGSLPGVLLPVRFSARAGGEESEQPEPLAAPGAVLYALAVGCALGLVVEEMQDAKALPLTHHLAKEAVRARANRPNRFLYGLPPS